MTDLDPRALRDAAAELARAAGAVLREGHGRAHAPERKGRIDLVTEYDRRSERLVLDGLRRRFPGHAVLAEESGAHAGGPGGVRWIVDPLDGTTNFAHNYPFFCVSIAAEVDGELAAGVVYDPVRDELFAAAAGHGATRDGEPLRVSDVARVEDALLVTGFPYDVRERPERSLPHFAAFLVRAQAVRRDGSLLGTSKYPTILPLRRWRTSSVSSSTFSQVPVEPSSAMDWIRANQQSNN